MQRLFAWRCSPTSTAFAHLTTMARHRGPKKPAGAKKPPLTHFLCLPLVTELSRPQLERSLAAFREDVSTAPQSGTANNAEMPPPVHPKAIRPVGTSHCTLGVMSLDSQKLADAVAFLETLDIDSLLANASKTEQSSAAQSSVHEAAVQDARPNTESQPPLIVDLKGLISMHPAQRTSILYSEPQDSTGRLYDFCLALQKAFTDRGFLIEDDRKLKLHATIVNTIYAKGNKGRSKLTSSATAHVEDGEQSLHQKSGDGFNDRSQGHGPNANAPLKIDARVLLDRYKEHVWAANVQLDRVAICEMGAKKMEDADGHVIDQRYAEVASVTLPA